MKDFKIGQEVYVLKRDYIYLIRGVIIKKFESSNCWKVRFNFNEVFNRKEELKESIVERFQDDNEVFATFQEAYYEAMCIFDKRVQKIEEDRTRFRAETQTLTPSPTAQGMELPLKNIETLKP